MGERTAVLDVSRLVVGYAGVPVCGEVSFSVGAGDVVALVGVNGAGKSTVVRTLAGRQAALEGSTLVHGVPVDPDALSFRRRVASVFDDDAFFPALTVKEHLLLVARGHSVPDPEARVDAEILSFGLSDRADAVPDSLSSGQRRRLLLAAAFVRPSSLLILDEPEQRLDPFMRDAVAERLRVTADAGCAVVLVTHDPLLLARTASGCLVIDDVVSYVTPEQGAAAIAGA